MTGDGDRLRDLFLACLTLDAADRPSFLERECGEDRELRLKIERLLDKDALEDSFLDRPIPADAVAGLLRPPPEMTIEQVGPYRLAEEIGRGGMGVVFRASRNDGQFEQEVAVKVLSTVVFDRSARERFDRERGILARLEHPYIATLFDGGLARGVIPYYVMQLVRGEPIDRFCDRRRMTVRERLELFLKVCEAVQFAHDRFIVHRDLKPDNVLVTNDGNPKLLDFGIAKLITEAAPPEGEESEGRGTRWAMTPEYASPEQLRGEQVTAASDVYSLGVVLHQLLVGALPPELNRGTGAAEAGVARSGLNRSDILTLTAEARAAHDRRSTPARLRRELAGDLVKVVGKALRAEPGSRYPSTRELAAELRRYLAGFPVEARPVSWLGRNVRLVQRNRVSSALAAALVAVLLSSGVALGVQTMEIRRERDLAKQVTGFLVGLFQQSDPSEARGEALTAKDVLDRGAVRLRSELADNPELASHLAATIGVVYQNLGLLDDAETQLEQALAQRRRLYGNEHPEVAESAAELGNLLRVRGDYARAEVLLREALELRRLEGPDSASAAVTMTNLALVLVAQDRLDEAEALVREGLRILHSDHPKAQRDIADLLVSLGSMLLERGQLDEAEEYFRQGRDIRAELEGESPLLAQADNNLGEAMRRAGRYHEAEATLARAVAARRRLLGNNHPDLANSLSNLALVHYEKGELDEARELLTEACDIYRRTVGSESPAFAVGLNNLAALHFKAGNMEGAEAAFREVLALHRSSVGEDHSDTAQALQNLGAVLRARGNPAEAEALLSEALEIRLEVFGPRDARVASTQENLATALLDLGRVGRAEALYRDAMSSLDAALPSNHPSRARVRTRLGRALVLRHRFAEAETLLREALAVWEVSSGADPALLAEGRSLLLSCLARTGRVAEARELAVRLAASLEGATFSDPRTEEEILSRLIDFFRVQGAAEEATVLEARLASLTLS